MGESGVLGNALDGVPEEEDEANSSKVEDPAKMTEEEKKEVAEKVGEALKENLVELEKKDEENQTEDNKTTEDKDEVAKEDEGKSEEDKKEEGKEEDKKEEDEGMGEGADSQDDEEPNEAMETEKV